MQHNIPVYQPVTLKMKMLLKPLKVESGFDGYLLPMAKYYQSVFWIIRNLDVLMSTHLFYPNTAVPLLFSGLCLIGDKKTGVCVQQMDIGIDTGIFCLPKETDIGINETSEELFERLSVIGADALIKTIDLIIKGQTKPCSSACR